MELAVYLLVESRTTAMLGNSTPADVNAADECVLQT
jgi:hypothetical protein